MGASERTAADAVTIKHGFILADTFRARVIQDSD